MRIAFVLASLLTLAACAPGNPWGNPYAGSPGSVYDVAANPPQANGVVTYNPANSAPPPSSARQGGASGIATPAASMPNVPGTGMPQGQ